MTFIIVYLLVIFLFSINRKWSHQLSIIVLSILFASRNKSVPDTVPYMEMYNDVSGYGGIEPGFLRICEFFHNLGIPFSVFIFIISIIMLETWYYCTQRIFGKNSVGVMAIMMLSYFGFYFYGMVLRSAIAITLCYIGVMVLLTKKINWYSYLKYYIIVFLAFQFHQSVVLFSLAPLMLVKFNLKLQYLIAVSSFLFLFITDILPIKNYLELYLNAYEGSRFGYFLERDFNSTRAGIRSVLYSVISVFSVYCASKVNPNCDQRRIIDFFVNIYIVGAIINSLIWELPAATRLPMNWLFFEFAVVYCVTFYNNQLIKQKRLIILMYTIISFAVLLHSFPLILNY